MGERIGQKGSKKKTESPNKPHVPRTGLLVVAKLENQGFHSKAREVLDAILPSPITAADIDSGLLDGVDLTKK